MPNNNFYFQLSTPTIQIKIPQLFVLKLFICKWRDLVCHKFSRTSEILNQPNTSINPNSSQKYLSYLECWSSPNLIRMLFRLFWVLRVYISSTTYIISSNTMLEISHFIYIGCRALWNILFTARTIPLLLSTIPSSCMFSSSFIVSFRMYINLLIHEYCIFFPFFLKPRRGKKEEWCELFANYIILAEETKKNRTCKGQGRERALQITPFFINWAY